MTGRPDLEIDGLDRAEGAFGLAQTLVGPHDIAGSERGLLEIGADDVEAIEFGLGLDATGVAGEGEAVVGDGQGEVLGHLVPMEHRTAAQPDLLCAAPRPGLAARGLAYLPH